MTIPRLVVLMANSPHSSSLFRTERLTAKSLSDGYPSLNDG